MGLAFQRIKVYSKLAVVAVVAIVILVVVIKNRGNVANVWLFRPYEIATLWLMLLTSVVAIVAWWLLWGVRRLALDWRKLRQEEAAGEKLAEQKRLAEELAAREQRIDEKIKGTISDGD